MRRPAGPARCVLVTRTYVGAPRRLRRLARLYFCRRADALMAGQHAPKIDAEWLEALARQSLGKPGQWLHQVVDFSPALSV